MIKVLSLCFLICLYSYPGYALQKDIPRALSLKTQARTLSTQNSHEQAGDLYTQAIQLGLTSKSLYTWAATEYAKAGHKDKTLTALEQLADLGSDHRKMLADKKLFGFLDGSKGLKAVKQKFVQNASLPNPAKAFAMDLTNVDHFFDAFDKAEKAKEADKQAIYAAHYFNKATPAMIDYIANKISSAEAFTDYVEARRPYYAELRSMAAKIKAQRSKAKQAVESMRDFVGEGPLPQVHFIVGMHTSAGTASENGMLLGMDFVNATSKHKDMIADWTYDFLSTPASSIWIIVHEYVHFIQDTRGSTILDVAIIEGGADFLADHFYMNGSKDKGYNKFGRKHAARVTKEFMDNVQSTNYERWSGNNGSITDKNWHPDLAYYIGREISARYFANTVDKKQAVIDLLKKTDRKKILEVSGFGTNYKK